MNNRPKIAVLLASYNGEAFVKEQIESIINQSQVSLCIYVSDDGSHDDTISIIQKLKYKHNIELIETNLRGGSAANNFFNLVKTLALNDFEYVAFADQDDIWLRNKLFNGITKIKENNAEGYSSNFTILKGGKIHGKSNKGVRQTKYDFLFSSPGPGCTFILTRKSYSSLRMELIKNSEAFYDCRYHDWAIYAYYRSNNQKWIIDNNSYILYRQHSNNDTGANKGINAYVKRFKLIQKKWYSLEVNRIFNLSACYKHDLKEEFKHISPLKFSYIILMYSRRKLVERVLVFLLYLFQLIHRRSFS